MKILLTGATGYIGKRLLPKLLQQNHQVVCCVRDSLRFKTPEGFEDQIEVVQCDLLDQESLENIPKDIDLAFYLVHSMSAGTDYEQKEQISAENFVEYINTTSALRIVYLSGIVNEENLSKHLSSRKKVEQILGSKQVNCLTLRAGIIIGSGSASFEIIRDLVEKLPAMITPRWLNTKCQPITIAEVLHCLMATLHYEIQENENHDIGGPDILSYKQMLLLFAQERGLKRRIWTLPVMTPRLSSYWLYFVTSTTYHLAVALVNSMKIEVVCRNRDWMKAVKSPNITYKEALKRAFNKLENNEILSTWKDAMVIGNFNRKLEPFVQVPAFGCFKDHRTKPVINKEQVIQNIWTIGGKKGWYYGNWMWQIRGFLDKLVGGVGLNRGRAHPNKLFAGDSLDFWRVLLANREAGRLLLYAEMKLPGEAWLEFEIKGHTLHQTATFRPKGILGRLYWYAVLPFHGFIFSGMISRIANS